MKELYLVESPCSKSEKSAPEILTERKYRGGGDTEWDILPEGNT